MFDFLFSVPVRLGGKSAEIPYQYAEIPKQKHPKQKHRTYRAWGAKLDEKTEN